MRIRATSLVIAAVVLAGCLGGVGTDPATEGQPETEWTTDGGINETALVQAHFAALRTAGSFNYNHTSSIKIDGDARPKRPLPEWYRPPSLTHEQIDLDESRLRYTSIDVGHRRVSKFISSDVIAERRRGCPSENCSWEYDYDRRPEGDTLAQQIDRYRRDRIVEMYVEILDDWAFTYVGTERLDGELAYRYRANWTLDRPMHPFAAPPDGNATLVVTSDGVIRRWATTFSGPAEVSVDGETQTASVAQHDVYTFYAVGETTVERPAWVDRAQAGHQPRQTQTGQR